MPLQNHLTELERKHRALEREIQDTLNRPSMDDMRLAELKRRKLQLKDEIARLRTSEYGGALAASFTENSHTKKPSLHSRSGGFLLAGSKQRSRAVIDKLGADEDQQHIDGRIEALARDAPHQQHAGPGGGDRHRKQGCRPSPCSRT